MNLYVVVTNLLPLQKFTRLEENCKIHEMYKKQDKGKISSHTKNVARYQFFFNRIINTRLEGPSFLIFKIHMIP